MFGSRPSRSMGQTEWASDQQTIASNEIAETLLSVNKEREGLRRFFNLQLVQISLDTFMCICVWPVLWKTNISWYIRGSAYRFDSRHEQYFFLWWWWSVAQRRRQAQALIWVQSTKPEGAKRLRMRSTKPEEAKRVDVPEWAQRM